MVCYLLQFGISAKFTRVDFQPFLLHSIARPITLRLSALFSSLAFFVVVVADV